MKTGRLGKEEWDFIKANHTRMSYVEMAAHLDRAVDSIRNYVVNKLGVNVVGTEAREEKAEHDIMKRAYWKDLKRQFNEDELEMLVFHWKRIVSSFKNEIFPTEELQLIDVIKLEVLMNRLLIQQQDAMVMVQGFKASLKDEMDKDVDDRDANLIISLQDQIASMLGAQESISREYKDMLQEKNKILRDMKATRDQRMKRVENSSQSFLGWMVEVMGNTELRRELGVRMEKMRLATEQEKKRLSKPHTYVDKEVDLPFLNHASLEEYEKSDDK